jgi:predicted DNA binding CopG/RHH family protein
MNHEQLNPPRQAWETAPYEDDPFEVGDIEVAQVKIVSKDFLPRPEALVFKKAKPAQRKVTLVLDDFTIQAFKGKAHELGSSYQAMMRQLLLEYARTFEAEREKKAA